MKEWLHTLLMVLFVALILGGVAYWVNDNYELRPVEEEQGVRGEAKYNDLYYARLFLKRMGLPADSKGSVTPLPPPNTVIVLDTERYTLSQNTVQQLWDWVNQGGHLITLLRSPNYYDEETESEKSAAAKDAKPAEKPKSLPNPDAKSSQQSDLLQDLLKVSTGKHQVAKGDEDTLTITMPNSSQRYTVESDFYNGIQSTQQDWAVPAPQGNQWLVHKRQGQGAVTLLSDSSFMHNYTIGDQDHAEFFWQLVHLQQTPQHVWLLANDKSPSLLSVLWESGWTVVVSLATLLGLSFWYFMPRFGALIPLPPPTRGRFIEHLQASGRFEWYQQPQGREQMLQPLRDGILLLAPKRIPNWLSLETPERMQALGQPLQQTAAQVTTLLQAPVLNDAAFIRLVQLHHYWRQSTP